MRRIQGKEKKDWSIKGWITDSNGFPPETDLGETPESNAVHGPIDAATLPGIGSITKWAATESLTNNRLAIFCRTLRKTAIY
ncbi:hypothetical protein LZD49_06760 [Dyadobacter sp. CY261]|uniref:hypothetical protein n=1 Tax=Dyadobacter sp. CY261 TaxID=2907203 RepID=UPI001F220524|nr:hypothetical protein [Dyadobacter sp. CY261]MCF0070166.1 hypothetical protein [Dyadobacter sp. CY261]